MDLECDETPHCCGKQSITGHGFDNAYCEITQNLFEQGQPATCYVDARRLEYVLPHCVAATQTHADV